MNLRNKPFSLVLAMFSLMLLMSVTNFGCTKSSDTIAKVSHYPYRPLEAVDIAQEIQEMEKRVAVPVPQATDLGMLGGYYYAQGKLTGDISWFDKAEATAQRSLKIQPIANSGSKLILAKVKASRHEFTDSIKLATEAHDADAAKTSALAILANSYLALGDLNQAGIFADQFVDQTPGLESYGLRALVMDAQGRFDEAVSDFERALEIEDLGEAQESAWVRSLFARTLMRVGDYAHARTLLEEALKTVPKYHLAFDLLGDLSTREGDYANAEKFYKSAFESSKQLAYLTHYSRLKELMGEKSVAGEIQTQAEVLIRAELAKNGVGHRLDLASILLDRGGKNDIPEALKLAQEDVQNRHSVLAEGVLARAELASGQAKDALKTMRELLRSGTRDPDYYFQMALVERAVGNPRLAKFYMDEAIKTDSKNKIYQKANQDFAKSLTQTHP